VVVKKRKAQYERGTENKVTVLIYPYRNNAVVWPNISNPKTTCLRNMIKV
jgi:hypothetical protein